MSTHSPSGTAPVRHPHLRKKVVIDARFQWGLVATFGGIAVLSNAYLWFMLRSVFDDLRAAGMLAGLGPSSPIFARIDENHALALALLLGANLVVLLVISAIGILFTHRVLGPVYRIRRHLDDVAEGRTTADVKLREKDYFKDLEAAANKLMAAIRAGKFRS